MTSLLLRRFTERANDTRTCVHDALGAHSYADVVRRARSVHGALRALEGKRVALLAPPGADFVSGFFGILLAGGVVVVLSPLHPAAETAYFCADAGVTRTLVAASLADHAPGMPLEPLLQAAPALDAPVDARAPALQLYTSGTTGKPKGAVLTHENLGTQQTELGRAWGFTERDVLLHALPLHHMHGLVIALLTALGAGAALRMRAFDAPAIWEEMKDATSFMAVPAMYHRLFVAFDATSEDVRARWSTHARALRLATSGSAALPVTLAERWRALTGAIPLERFGMTEIGVGLTNALDGARFPGCVGFPLPTVEARIVDETGADAEIGELVVRGPSVFAGYHARPEETAKAFRDGWFRTGDTVTRDAALPGAPYRVLGRTSVDILKSGGYKLSALEIEEALREHPAVLEAAVVGIADEAWGDRVTACIVTRAPCTADELRAFVRERLAPYKVPKDVCFLEELPKNALGKVQKPELVRRLSAPSEA